MFKLFNAEETVFDHNRTILQEVLSATVKEVGNGDFSLEMSLPLKFSDIEVGQIVTAPTPRGIQPFRIFSDKVTLKNVEVKARHIFYDSANNFLADCRPTGVDGMGALTHIENGRLNQSPLELSSDIPLIGTAYYVRKNELEALLGAENSFLKVWGGYLIRDGWKVHFRNEPRDRGYEVSLGKNITGIEAVEDSQNVVTVLMPTFVLEDNNVYTLPEVYIRSPIADNYPQDIVREFRVDLTEAQRKQTPESLHSYIREQALLHFESGADKPTLSYRVNFIDLSKTEDYKHLGILNELDIFDVVTCDLKSLGTKVKLVMRGYSYDAIKQKFISMDLGTTRPTNSSLQKRIQRTMEEQMVREDSPLMQKVNAKQKLISDRISGNSGGNFIIRYDEATNTPYETLWMDTPDINTAKEVIRINKDGIAVSKNGYLGEYEIAFTAQDGLYAKFIYGLKITASMIEAGAVTAEKIATNAITADKLASRAITADKIKAGAITANEIAGQTITSAEIKSGAITADKLSAGAISADKITSGRIISSDGTSYFDLDSGYIKASSGQFSGTVTASNISNSNFSGSNPYTGSSYSFGSSGANSTTKMDSTSMTAKTFDFQSGKIQNGVQIGNYMYASGNGIFFNGSGYVCSFESQGNAWIAIHKGSNNDRFTASNLIWGVTTNGVVYTSDLSTKKDLSQVDPQLAIDFIRDLKYWEYTRKSDDVSRLGIVANFLKYSDNPLAEYVLAEYDNGVDAKILTVDYDQLAIINGIAVKELGERVSRLETQLQQIQNQLEVGRHRWI